MNETKVVTGLIKSAQDFVEPKPLSIEQEKALPCLMVGMSDAAVAEQVGVSRETVNRWRKQDSSFKLALEILRRETWEGLRDRIMGLAGKALDVIEDHLDQNGSSGK